VLVRGGNGQGPSLPLMNLSFEGIMNINGVCPDIAVLGANFGAVPLRLSTRISLVSSTGLPANASCCGTRHDAPPKSLLPLLRGILTKNWYCLRTHAHRGGLDPFARQQVNGRVGRRGPNKCCSDELQPGGAIRNARRRGLHATRLFVPNWSRQLGCGAIWPLPRVVEGQDSESFSLIGGCLW
jgi:hypothetical protein